MPPWEWFLKKDFEAVMAQGLQMFERRAFLEEEMASGKTLKWVYLNKENTAYQ